MILVALRREISFHLLLKEIFHRYQLQAVGMSKAAITLVGNLRNSLLYHVLEAKGNTTFDESNVHTYKNDVNYMHYAIYSYT